MRVGFRLIGGDFWTGGLNYLESLLSVIQVHLGGQLTPVLFAGPHADPASLKRLSPLLPEPVRIDRACDGGFRSRAGGALATLLTGHDPAVSRLLKEARIDVFFQHSTWLGYRFPLPTIAWIPDFQHLRRPDMFTPIERAKRSIGYELITRTCSHIMVSSRDAQGDCQRFYPRTIGRVSAVPFVPLMDSEPTESMLRETRNRHELPERFLFMPNQLWLHKNHLHVIQAMQLLAVAGNPPTIIACGNPKDYRRPDHPQQVIQAIEASGLHRHFRFLGLVPRADLACLLRLSSGLLNPSFFEGWSTTVEEAKAIGLPLILSDIPVHREQAAGHPVEFFEPDQPSRIAEALRIAWTRFMPVRSRGRLDQARERYERARHRFAQEFLQTAHAALDAP
jgi:glycosyltransferase involved in cell wall biosynthesis